MIVSSLSSFPVSLGLSVLEIRPTRFAVGEDEEVSIKEVADAIVKAVGFEGKYSVRSHHDHPSFIIDFYSV